MATIATHNGSVVHRDHNIRNRRVTDKETHIDRDGEYEIWHDETVKAAYKRLFDEARKNYNKKVESRRERQINDYLKKIKEDDKKHVAYEMIVGVYGNSNRNLNKQILSEFVETWSDRNPNLELIGAYYHADEQGEPHVHIDYVPIAHNYSRGMETQTGLVKALGEQGFHKHGKETAQIQWQRRENQTLERICNEHGLSIEHPECDQKQHLTTECYKMKQSLERLQGRILAAEEIKAREVDKSVFGRSKDSITVPYSEYKSLVATAKEIETLRSVRQEALKIERTWQNRVDQIEAKEQSLIQREATLAHRETNIESEILTRAFDMSSVIENEFFIYKNLVEQHRLLTGLEKEHEKEKRFDIER